MDMVERCVLTAVCVVCVALPRLGFYDGCAWWRHLVWHFFHANVFHLAGNLLCLWVMKVRVRALRAWAVATAVSWLPCGVWDWSALWWTDVETVGLSGMLFASFGMAWGEYGDWRVMLRKVLPVVAVTGFLPGMNMWVHLWSFAGGWVLGRVKIKNM